MTVSIFSQNIPLRIKLGYEKIYIFLQSVPHCSANLNEHYNLKLKLFTHPYRPVTVKVDLYCSAHISGPAVIFFCLSCPAETSVLWQFWNIEAEATGGE